MAYRAYNEAKQALEELEGYYEIPSEVRARAMQENGGSFSIKDIDRRDMVFHQGLIHKLASEASRLKESSNLGKRFENRTFSNFEKRRNEYAFNAAARYANRTDLFENSVNSLIFVGGTGTGKTHLAASIANRLMDIGVPTMFATYQSHLDNIKKEFDATGQRKYLDEIRNIPMLILDDLGKERQSEWTQSILFDIVNYRYEHLLPTVFTTNLEAYDLEKYCGEAVWSRFFEMCELIEMNGSDYRKQ